MKIEVIIDDKKVELFKSFFKKKRILVMSILLFVSISVIVIASGAELYVFSPDTKIVSSEVNHNFQLLTSEINAIKEWQTKIKKDYPPIGTIMPFAGSADKIPEGWALCDGSVKNITEMQELYDIIGQAWGGDGSATFNLPDLRGRFLRGVDGDAGVDPNKNTRTALYTGGNTGNIVGSYQGDATAKNGLVMASSGSHFHSQWVSVNGNELPNTSYSSNNFGTAADAGSGANNYHINPHASGNGYNTGSAGTHSHTISGDSETRSVNANVNYIIKYSSGSNSL